MGNYKSYAAIIYVTETEKQAVMRMFDWKDLSVPGDSQEYMETFIEKKRSKAQGYQRKAG